MYFDTHAHYDDEAFDADRDELLSSLPEAGVTLVIDPGCDVSSSEKAIALAERFPHVYAAVGIHPEELGGMQAGDLEKIEALCAHEKCVAIGEIGLDYYWDDTHKEEQKALFIQQLELAIDHDLPVIIHDREAHGDSLDIVRRCPDVRGVFHCYSGSKEMAEELLIDVRSYADIDRGVSLCGTLTLVLFLVYSCKEPTALLSEIRTAFDEVRRHDA